jgi:hypothetical protein
MPRRASPRARVSAASTHSSCPVPAQVPSSVRNSGPTLPGSRYASEMLRYAATAHARWSPPAQARSSTCITAVVSVVLVPAWTRKQATALPSLQAAMRPAPSTARRRLLSASLPARKARSRTSRHASTLRPWLQPRSASLAASDGPAGGGAPVLAGAAAARSRAAQAATAQPLASRSVQADRPSL